MSTIMGWAKVKTAAHYANVSERTFREWLKEGLRYVRMKTGTILIKYTWIDQFLEQFVVCETDNINKIVDSALEGLLS